VLREGVYGHAWWDGGAHARGGLVDEKPAAAGGRAAPGIDQSAESQHRSPSGRVRTHGA